MPAHGRVNGPRKWYGPAPHSPVLEKHKKARELAEQGVSATDGARQMGIHKSTFQRWVVHAGGDLYKSGMEHAQHLAERGRVVGLLSKQAARQRALGIALMHLEDAYYYSRKAREPYTVTYYSQIKDVVHVWERSEPPAHEVHAYIRASTAATNAAMALIRVFWQGDVQEQAKSTFEAIVEALAAAHEQAGDTEMAARLDDAVTTLASTDGGPLDAEDVNH